MTKFSFWAKLFKLSQLDIQCFENYEIKVIIRSKCLGEAQEQGKCPQWDKTLRETRCTKESAISVKSAR